MSGIFILLLFVCRFFSVRIPRSRKVSESEQEIHKLYIAAHANPIPHMLPEIFRNTERAALGFAVWSGILRLRELQLLS